MCLELLWLHGFFGAEDDMKYHRAATEAADEPPSRGASLEAQSGRIAIVNGGVGFWRCALLGYSAVDAHGEQEFYWMLATSIGSPQRLRLMTAW